MDTHKASNVMNVIFALNSISFMFFFEMDEYLLHLIRRKMIGKGSPFAQSE
jgi:hypothetical protein